MQPGALRGMCCRAEHPVSIAGILQRYRALLRDGSFHAHFGIAACNCAGLFFLDFRVGSAKPTRLAVRTNPVRCRREPIASELNLSGLEATRLA